MPTSKNLYAAVLLMSLTTNGCLAVDPPQRAENRLPKLAQDGCFWVFNQTHLNGWRPSDWMPAQAAQMIAEVDPKAPAAAGSTRPCIRVRIAGWSAPYWCGVTWVVANPASPDAAYWGDLPATAWNLTGATSVVFKARAPKPCRIQFKAAMLKTDAAHPYADAAATPAATEYIALTSEWQTYAIDLTGVDLSRVVSAFGFVASRDEQSNPNAPIEFYLDEIRWQFPTVPQPSANAPSGACTFAVYRDKNENGWVPANWMPAEATDMMKIEADSTDHPQEGANCLHVRIDKFVAPYWCGVAWALQDMAKPQASYWGETPLAGWNMQGARKVIFWARAPHPCRVQFKVCMFGDKPYGDSARFPAQTDFIALTPEWKCYEIDVAGLNLKRVISAFGFVVSRDEQRSASAPVDFYLDNISWECAAEPKRTGP